MTPAQRTSYFRRWSAACRAQGWKMVKGRLAAEPLPAPGSEAALVLQWAVQLGLDQHRAPVMDDLRYAIHLVACGKAISSQKLNNRQIDRVFALLDLLTEPDNLNFVMNWMNPEGRTEHWLREFIADHYQGEYIATLCERMHRGASLSQLPKPELLSLLRTLRDRPNAAKHQTADQPF
jgi:hypothetical protein